MTLTKEKAQAFEILKAGLEKKHGKGAIRFLGGDEVSAMARRSTGIFSLDLAIGGGYPKGRFIEIYGPESSGKTTVTLHAIAAAQAAGDVCAFIDAEHAFDIEYAKALGVDVEKLIINQPNSAEEALDIVEELTNSKLVDLIVVDSVAALVPQVELEGEMTDSNMGVHARLMSKACRKITGPASRNNVTIIWINQIRMKIGVMFGSPETTTGGNALKYYASIRLDIRKRNQIKVDDIAVATEAEIKVVKNKTAPPYRVAEFTIEFGKGVDRFTDLLRVAVQLKVIEKSGAWYSFKGTKIGQGEKNTAEFLRTNPTITEEVKALLAPKHVQNPDIITEE